MDTLTSLRVFCAVAEAEELFGRGGSPRPVPSHGQQARYPPRNRQQGVSGARRLHSREETLRVIRQPKSQTLGSSCDRPFAARIPATCEGTQLRTGALLAREWNGKLERVWNGETYGSLSQIAKAMTGTNWNGHRFFGLRTAKSDRSSKAGRNGWVSAPPDVASIQSTRDGKVRRRNGSLSATGAADQETALARTAARPNTGEAASP